MVEENQPKEPVYYEEIGGEVVAIGAGGENLGVVDTSKGYPTTVGPDISGTPTESVIGQVNQPVDGSLKTPTPDDAMRARQLEIESGVTNPRTLDWWNQQLIQDYNRRVEIPSYDPRYKPGQMGTIKSQRAIGGGQVQAEPMVVEAELEIDKSKVKMLRSNPNYTFDNQYMPLEEWDRLPDKYKQIAEMQGTDALSAEIERDNAAIQAQLAVLGTLNKYESIVPGEEGYRLDVYLKDNSDRLNEAVNTLRAAGFTEEQISNARYEAFASKSGAIKAVLEEGFIGPPSPGEAVYREQPNVIESQVMGLEDWSARQREELVSGLRKGDLTASLLATGAAGAVVLGTDLLLAPLIIGGKIITNPAKAPSTIFETVKGMALQPVGTALSGLSGKYAYDLATGNAGSLVYDTAMSYLIITGLGKAGKAIASRVTTYIAPRGVPPEVIAKEASTGRIPVSIPEMSKAYADAMNKVEQLSMQKGGKFSGEVPIEGTPYSLRYLKTPAEQVTGDILFHGTKSEIGVESLLDIASREGVIKAGKSGIYTDPWAAIGYTRGGGNPGLLMILTDSAKIRSGSKGLAKGLTQSDDFIKSAEPGFYGPSKVWRGDLETEIVGAPGTKIEVPLPEADLLTRMTVGKYADLFTYDSGKFVPIKVGLDVKSFKPETLKAVKSPSTWYAIKLYSLYGSLRDAAEAAKHPGLVLKDISGIAKEMVNIDRFLREGTGSKGGLTMPGLRDVYLTESLGSRLRGIANKITNDAFIKTQREVGKVDPNSSAFRRALERNMEESYRASANTLINSYRDIARQYSSDPVLRSKLEASYLTNLKLSSESIVKSSGVASSLLDRALSDVSSRRIDTDSSVNAMREYERIKSVIESPVSSASARSEVIESRPVESTVSEIRSVESRIIEPRPREPISREPRPPEPPEPPESRTPERRRPPEEPIVLPLMSNIGESAGRIPQGAIAWKQGLFWKYIPPPFNQDKPVTLPQGVTPIGAIRTDLRTPEETVQMIGDPGAGVPEEISIDNGIVDIFISEGGNNIEFVGAGAKTNIGESLPSKTKGMSFRDNRRKQLKPKRSKRVSGYDYMTTLKGFKL